LRELTIPQPSRAMPEPVPNNESSTQIGGINSRVNSSVIVFSKLSQNRDYIAHLNASSRQHFHDMISDKSRDLIVENLHLDYLPRSPMFLTWIRFWAFSTAAGRSTKFSDWDYARDSIWFLDTQRRMLGLNVSFLNWLLSV
jgi:hypothetical protein